jgi:hypothetical protein
MAGTVAYKPKAAPTSLSGTIIAVASSILISLKNRKCMCTQMDHPYTLSLDQHIIRHSMAIALAE